jgi:hypothetical protein
MTYDSDTGTISMSGGNYIYYVDDCPGVLSIQAGDYAEGALTINKSVKLEARNGLVHIH